jgi:hypothetical protein
MRSRTRATILGAALMALLVVAAPAAAEPTWAPAGEADIRPGSMTFTEGGQCTSNFVFFDAEDNVYIGQAAHCAGTGGATATNGCDTESLPLGTEVEIEGAEQPGTLAYSSWLAMQEAGETDLETCQFNDFALVQIDPNDVDEVNPTIPVLGGPTGLDPTTSTLEPVSSYGNSSLRQGIDLLKPKTGTSLGQVASGWTHNVLTVTPGIPGDSGSGFIDEEGRAFGTLSTLQFLPLAGSNGVSDLTLALDYMRSSGFDAELAEATEEFRSSALPLLGSLLPRG